MLVGSTTCYRAAFTEPVSITLTYDQPVGINAYSITASKNEPTRDPAEWTLEGSNDGSTWTQLDSRSGQSFSHRYATQFYMPNGQLAMGNEQFTTYRLTVTATASANQIQIGELQLLSMEPVDPTGIETTYNPQRTMSNEIYNLSGQRVSDIKNLHRGIYIKNGKKVVVKF